MNDDKLAKKWGCVSRTIRNWRKAGAPLSDPAAMRTWLAAQKHLPAGTLAILTFARSKERAKANVQLAAGPPLSGGATFALRRLEQAEARAHSAAVTAEATNDSVEIRLAETRWLRIAASLLRYDLALEQSRRDSGELIRREEVERIVSGFCTYARTGLLGALSGLAPKLIGMTTPREAWRVLKVAEAELRLNILTALKTWTYQQSPFPPWLWKIASEAFQVFPDTESNEAVRLECFQGFCKEIAAYRAAERENISDS